MKPWIITDTHFGHDKLVEYSGRPINHSEIILKNLECIKSGNILIHLGDFCIGNDEKWCRDFFDKLKGVRVILVKGNHDNKSNSWYLSHGFDFVCDSFEDVYFGKRILFSHCPIKNRDYDINIHGHFHNNLHRLLKGDYKVEGEKERNMIHLSLLTKKHRLLSMENTNYSPVLLERLLTISPVVEGDEQPEMV